jgi:hypothetical protein
MNFFENMKILHLVYEDGAYSMFLHCVQINAF